MAKNKLCGITEKEVLALDFWDVKEVFDRAGVGNFGCYSNSFPGKNGVTITSYEVGIELREQDCSWSRNPRFICSASFTEEKEKDWYKAKVVCDFYKMVQDGIRDGVKTPFQENAVALCHELDRLVKEKAKNIKDKDMPVKDMPATRSNMPVVNDRHVSFTLPVKVERKGRAVELIARLAKGPYDKDSVLRDMKNRVSGDIDKVMGQLAVALSDGDKVKETVFRLAVANVLEKKDAIESIEFTAQSLEAATYFEWAGDSKRRDEHLANADEMKNILIDNVLHDALEIANKDKNFNMSIDESFNKVMGANEQQKDVSIVKVKTDDLEKISAWTKNPDFFVITLEDGCYDKISEREGQHGSKVTEITKEKDGEVMRFSITGNVEQLKAEGAVLLAIDKKDSVVCLDCRVKEKTWVNEGIVSLDGQDKNTAKAVAFSKQFAGFAIEQYREDIEGLRKPAVKHVNRNVNRNKRVSLRLNRTRGNSQEPAKQVSDDFQK